jgi:hypothetical protein
MEDVGPTSLGSSWSAPVDQRREQRGARPVHDLQGGDDVTRRPWPFRFLRKGNHWAALHDIESDHLLYIVASNTASSDIELERLDNLAAYAPPLTR